MDYDFGGHYSYDDVRSLHRNHVKWLIKEYPKYQDRYGSYADRRNFQVRVTRHLQAKLYWVFGIYLHKRKEEDHLDYQIRVDNRYRKELEAAVGGK